MASSIPTQRRAVDPFASYNSNEVNKISQAVSLGDNGLLGYNALQVEQNDTTSVNVTTGFALIDDVIMEITAQHTVDFYDADHYDDPTAPIPTVGFNYVVLRYAWSKSRPAPQASIKIVKATDTTATWNIGAILLKVVQVTEPSPNVYEISSLLDYNPSIPAHQRQFVRTYAGSRGTVPVFDAGRDQSRILYSSVEDSFFFGLSDRWVDLGGRGATIVADTSGLTVGDLAYINGLGDAAAAFSQFAITTSDGVVTSVGTPVSNPPGVVQTTGKVEDVPIESGVSLNVGDLLYLSITDPGTVTNIEDPPFSQFVGRCLATDSTACDMLYVRGTVSVEELASVAGGVAETIGIGDWVSDSGMYRYDIDMTGKVINQTGLVMAYDSTSNLVIEPTLVDWTSGTNLRIWMTETKQLRIVVVGDTAVVGSNPVEIARGTLASGSWTTDSTSEYQNFVHSLGTTDVVIGVQDNSNLKFRPDDIEIIDANTVRIWMPVGTSLEGEIIAVGVVGSSSTLYSSRRVNLDSADWTLEGTTVSGGGGYIHTEGIAATTWTVSHSLGSKYVIVEVIDAADTTLIPSSITFDNANQLTITFASAKAGRAVVIATSGVVAGTRYYQDINIGTINNGNTAVEVFNNDTDEKVEPDDVSFIDSDTVRILMPTNTENLRAIVIG